MLQPFPSGFLFDPWNAWELCWRAARFWQAVRTQSVLPGRGWDFQHLPIVCEHGGVDSCVRSSAKVQSLMVDVLRNSEFVLPGADRTHIGVSSGVVGAFSFVPLFCLVKVGLKPQLKVSASARVLQEGNDKRNWLLSYKFCLGCRASLNAGQGRNRRETKASMFCNHNALELCDLVLDAWAGCSLIVSLWCYLTPIVKQCSLPASVGKIDSATCKNSMGL